MRIVVLDAETSLHNDGEQAVGKFKAAPFHPDNWIVWLGLQFLNDDLTDASAIATYKFPDQKSASIPVPKRGKDGKLMIVGHNIKYDLEFLCGPGNIKRSDWIECINHPDTYVWCTMQAEFRLLGQTQIQPSLDWCCSRRGWELKPGRLKEYWKEGISTEDIADEEVQPYLEHDIRSTANLFWHQVQLAQERKMLPLLRMEMDAITSTTCMEVNGMYFDKQAARTHMLDNLLPKYDVMLKELTEIIAEQIGVPPTVVNPLSNPFLTSYFYGGGWKWQQHELMYNDDGTPVNFKSGKRKGQHKTQVVRYTPELPRRVKITDKEREKTYTGVDEELLNKLVDKGKTNAIDKDIIKRLMDLRELKKLSSTYFDGYSKLVWYDGMIRTSLNHAVAATARLSSSKPNLQNAAHNEVRSYFQSRYDGGHLLEIDLSQIEVVIQAFKSQDPNMMRDVRDGIDFHCKRGALVEHIEYAEFFELAKVQEVPKYVKIRKGAKQFSFQRAYGAGAPTIADKTGLSLAEVKAFISAEEAEYPAVVEMQDKWIAAVKRSTKKRDGLVCGELVDVTGALYRFKREQFKGDWTYKPTTIKNYPIQGQAGEVLKLILNEVRKFLWAYNVKHCTAQSQGPRGEGWNYEPVLMVNTVHDSVIFDLPAWVNIPELAGELIAVFERADKYMSERFNIDFNLPIRADAEYGTDWFSMKTVTGE